MRKILLALCCMSLLASTLVAGSAHAQAGRSYAVNVTTSEGGEFTDCFTFNDDGTLLLAALIDVLGWHRLNLDTKKNSFQAAAKTDNADGISLAFSGKAKPNSIKADGFNPDDGVSFKVKGKKTDSCETVRIAGPNPWIRPRR
ncbi:MAG: hypothetical protein GKS06_14445 [Acidobacteria bacterium]|nr:hypothetical protein [Acidobacteriota bacterium]